MLCAALTGIASFAANVVVSHLTTENMTNPLGLGTTVPRFSWQLSSEKRQVVQTAYHIMVASTPRLLERGEADLWNSGEVKSDAQLWIDYRGRALQSGDEAYWRVRVTTNRGKTEWSAVQRFTIGLLGENRWSGRWIGLEELQSGERKGMYTRLAARYLRKEFKLKGRVKRAMAYVAGLGVHEFFVNGIRMGGHHVLQPVPSDYRKTVYYNTYDVTEPLNASHTACLAIMLGNGRLFPMRQEKPYKTPFFGYPKCRINVRIDYEDGSHAVWATDPSWKLTVDGPIRANNEYDGEEYDARKEMPGWNRVGFDDSRWQEARRCAVPDGTLRPQPTEGMVETPYPHRPRILSPLGNHKSTSLPPATHHPSPLILDFGQNMAGWIGLKVRGNRGDTIHVRYAEKLNADGTLYRDNLRNARSEDIYVCNGREGGRLWKPAFSYHGFRYVEVSGPVTATPDDFTAFTVSDEMATTGHFECSDTTLNAVVRNAWWGIYGNYKGMPVDCPQRNERQPWLGDRTVGCLGESFLFNNERLYSKWMGDLAEGVRSDGALSNVTPAFWNYYEDNVTWPAVFPFACDMLYQQYGNIRPITECYPYIKKWFTHILDEYRHEDIITKDKYGDWCVPPEKPELIHSQDPARKTDGALISTAYGIRVLQLLEKFARLQGMECEADCWKEQHSRMTAAFNRKFLTLKRGTSPRPGHVLYPDSVFYGNNTATANLLPLAFGIVPDSLKDEVVKNVVTNIITTGDGHVTCGVIGISWLLRGLSDNGFADVAYLLATNNTYPSWGYMAKNGATTIWELWNGDKADPAMNSGNHVMLLGDLLTWCYQYLAGIRQAPGSTAYKHIVLQPSFDIEDCFHVDASYMTPYGRVVSKWKKTLERVEWQVEVPVNTTATVYLPNGKTEEIGSGSYTFESDITPKNPAIVEDAFLYESADFPQAHASTITQLKNGDLVAAYFGGTWERNPNVCIWVSRKPKGSDRWEAPVLAGDGVYELGTPDAELAGIDEKTTPASAGPIKQRRGEQLKDYRQQIAHWHYTYPQTKEEAAATKPKNMLFNARLKRKACWNPVLFTMPDGELWLFYKVGATVADWTGWLVKSRDGGRTWSDREPLPKGFIGPVKNKPELVDGRLVCGSSTENDGWRFHVEILDLKTGRWKYVGPVEAESRARTDDVEPGCDMVAPVYKQGEGPRPIYSIQPSILRLKDGRLQVLMRTHNAKLATSFSADGGDTWSPVTLTEVPNNQSGTDAVTLRDGRHVLIYNDFETLPGTKKGPRTPISIALSDDGTHWHHALTLEDSPINQYSYPAIIEGRDGKLHCVYTWRRQRIAYKKIDLNKLK